MSQNRFPRVKELKQFKELASLDVDTSSAMRLFQKLPKDKTGSDCGTKRWYLKFYKPHTFIDGKNDLEAYSGENNELSTYSELISLEYQRLIRHQQSIKKPGQPKTRLVTTPIKGQYAIASEEIVKARTVEDMPTSEITAIVQNYHYGMGLGEVVVNLLVVNAFDPNLSNLLLDKYNRFISIDGDNNFARIQDLKSDDNDNYDFHNITTSDLQSLPYLSLSNKGYKSYEWLDQFLINPPQQGLFKELMENKDFRLEVNQTILKNLSLRNHLIHRFTQFYLGEKQGVKFANELIQQINSLCRAAFANESFCEYLSQPRALMDYYEFIHSLKSFKLMSKHYLIHPDDRLGLLFQLPLEKNFECLSLVMQDYLNEQQCLLFLLLTGIGQETLAKNADVCAAISLSTFKKSTILRYLFKRNNKYLYWLYTTPQGLTILWQAPAIRKMVVESGHIHSIYTDSPCLNILSPIDSLLKGQVIDCSGNLLPLGLKILSSPEFATLSPNEISLGSEVEFAFNAPWIKRLLKVDLDGKPFYQKIPAIYPLALEWLNNYYPHLLEDHKTAKNIKMQTEELVKQPSLWDSASSFFSSSSSSFSPLPIDAIASSSQESKEIDHDLPAAKGVRY